MKIKVSKVVRTIVLISIPVSIISAVAKSGGALIDNMPLDTSVYETDLLSENVSNIDIQSSSFFVNESCMEKTTKKEFAESSLKSKDKIEKSSTKETIIETAQVQDTPPTDTNEVATQLGKTSEGQTTQQVTENTSSLQYPILYTDETMSIKINKENHYDAVCYVAHIITSEPSRIQTTFASGNDSASWGSHATTSDVNKNTGAILTINGDFRDKSWGEGIGIVRNGDIVQNELMIDSIGITYDGNLVQCTGLTPNEVLARGIRDTWSFGPILVSDGEAVEWDDLSKHPRTFIGQVQRTDGKLEYYFIVADGRQNGYSNGLTCTEMGKIMKEKGCAIAYNLDGGGSSAIVYKGVLLNKPSEGVERYDADFINVR